MKTMFIDNSWQDVQRQIEWIAEDELLDEGYPPVKPSKAEQEWAQKIAKRIASRVMGQLDGGEYEADDHGLRCFATTAEPCEHEWVDARNSAVQSGEFCPKCNAIRASTHSATGEGEASDG